MKTIGVIGLAGIGLQRLEHLSAHDDVRTDWLCTRNQSLLAERAQRFGAAETTTDYRTMLADDALDAVCICTPNNLHAPMAEAAMLAGKDVLLEYPMGISLDQVDRLTAVARQTGRLLHLGATTRHEPQHLAIAARLADLGEPVEFHGTLALSYVWKWSRDQDVMGSFFALANFHMADQVVDWFGQPQWVAGSLWQRETDGDITAISGSMFFGYESNFSAHINYAMALPAQGEFSQFELISTGGRITWRGGVLKLYQPDGSAETIELGDDDACKRDTWQFVEELLGEPVTLTPEAAAVSTRLCLLAEQSASSGHAMLKI